MRQPKAWALRAWEGASLVGCKVRERRKGIAGTKSL